MKKTMIVAVVLAVFTSATSFADDQSSGCGLGWQVSKKNSLVSSFVRSITNAVTSNTIAMTIGSSGCSKHDIVMREKAAEYFAEANYLKLQTELAEGQGEHLVALGLILGCDRDLGAVLQSNYETIFPSDKVHPSVMLKNVRSSLKQSNVSCAVGA